MTAQGTSRSLAVALEHQLRLHTAHIDLAHEGRYRSTYHLDELFFELVGIAAPDLFVEAGAFDATASRRVAAAHPGTRVVAFEANPSNYELWTREVDFAQAGVDYLHLALSDASGPVTFHLRSSGNGAHEEVEDNSLLARRHDSSSVTGDEATVPATTLDSHFPCPGRSAMWVDVEGANREVLTGGPRFLGACDVVKIEVEDVPLWEGQWLAVDVFEAMLDAGLMPVARDVQAVGQYNVIFVGRALSAHAEVVAAVERFLRRQIRPELPGAVGWLRRNETVRRAARRARAQLRRR